MSTIRAQFRACLEKAVKLGLLSRNPVASTDPTKCPKPVLKILSENEVAKLMEVAKNRCCHILEKDAATEYEMKCSYLVVLLAIVSGIRKGEVLGLTWPFVHDSLLEVKHSI